MGIATLPYSGTCDIRRIPFGQSTAADHAVLAGITGKRIRLVAAFLKCEGSVSLTFKSGSTAISGVMPWADDDAFVLPECEAGWHETGVGEALNLTLSAAVAVNGTIVVMVGE
jgi:hypothetical protein